MEYKKWIERERRVRISILKDSHKNLKTKTYRICQNCSEICLCHEETCPNCNYEKIIEEWIDNIDSVVYSRIRCAYRFDHLIEYK